MDVNQLMKDAEAGFSTVKVGDSYKQSALTFLKQWLTDPQFSVYVPQLEHLIFAQHFDYLLDCFYQIIPFGTGGRRGEVGVGPNRINVWTIQSSAQGHSQYLLKKYGDAAKTRGVVLTFDVRVFTGNKYFDPKLPNPVLNLNGKDLSQAAAEVYAANGIKVFFFETFRTTPELSFAIRYLKCVSGDMFSASHNPPEHNGKKVYDEFGGQLIPPHDEELVDEVTQHVIEIKTISFEDAKQQGLIQLVGTEVDNAYIDTCTKLSLSSERDIDIVYTPLHGCGSTSVQKVLEKLGFRVQVDPNTSNPSGKFEHVTFNIPNPEVIQSFDSTLAFAQGTSADIILNSDPDADRIGVMVKHQGVWKFINGNEIGGMLSRYVIEKKKPTLAGKKGVIIKTDVTTNLITSICTKHNVEIIGNLLVGFKFIGEEMNKLEQAGRIDEFLMGCEESHGYIAGNYVRDKDAVVAAIWLSELSAELKKKGKTLIDYLEETYATYGYFRNYLTEIRLPGAEGMAQIQQIQNGLRTGKDLSFGEFVMQSMEDWADRKPFVSETDKAAKNGLVFRFSPVIGTTSIKVTVRPSGTEPKIKMYYEIGSEPFAIERVSEVRDQMEQLVKRLEKAFMKVCYKCVGVDFPDRGFLLFWQLPLADKMHYFEIEPQLAAIKDLPVDQKQAKFAELSTFLGSNPIQKFDEAFKAAYGSSFSAYTGVSA
ncbi:phospho-sugar mutase [Candidatus Cerribacteria bacterium 'Amazon FNV 2010 28 9']|uniref:Phospho-sugar mutase n=1 Tax=Candidatus Cerribacteria bacterium 'Amazon FNV 2010 28 9' TaxID=2081795 RepID=A0A317JP59_9BACT|nr:MAG: phospho-sugar mutase [Candidatus Cerribacteria bacterium 'Amazon FNV 2010 28 9']